MLVALPSAVAYGVAIYGVLGADYVGYGVRAGILGAIAIGLVTPALGGAPRLISAPCAPAAGSAVRARGGVGGRRPGCGWSGCTRTDRGFADAGRAASGCLQFLYGPWAAGG